MLTSSRFWAGLIAGLILHYAYMRFSAQRKAS